MIPPHPRQKLLVSAMEASIICFFAAKLPLGGHCEDRERSEGDEAIPQ